VSTKNNNNIESEKINVPTVIVIYKIKNLLSIILQAIKPIYNTFVAYPTLYNEKGLLPTLLDIIMIFLSELFRKIQIVYIYTSLKFNVDYIYIAVELNAVYLINAPS